MNKFKTFVRGLYERTQSAFSRFPVSMAIIMVGCTFMLLINWWSDYDASLPWLERMTLILWLVLPLFTAPTLFVGRKWSLFVGAALTAILFFTTGNELSGEDGLLLWLWGLSFYSLMFALPRWKKNENNGFWVYCQRVLFVLILGFICTGILALSLYLALESIRTLFEANIDYRWDSTISIFSFAFVLPIFVHVGLPEKWESFERLDEHPSFFKAISYYLLTPIAVLFFGILGAYVVKILVTQEWPSGQVSYPIVFLSAVVFGLYLISYPWRQNWQRWFFVTLLPFLAVYFISLGMRINQYGLTEMRYLGVLFGICLTFMALYFAFVKRQRLQMMIVPLTVVSFLFAFGPWGVFELPLRSQENRLEERLTELNLLKDGKLQEAESGIDQNTEVEISSMVRYIYERDRLTDLQAWSDVNLGLNPTYGMDVPTAFMKEMGLEYDPWGYVDTYEAQENMVSFYYYNDLYNQVYPITGFDAMASFDFNYYSSYDDPSLSPTVLDFKEWNKTLNLYLDKEGIITISDGKSALTFSTFDLREQLDQLNSESSWDGEHDVSEFMLEEENASMKVRLYFENLSGSYEKDTQQLSNMYTYGKLLVEFKN